ncbi:MAG: hypothetical protein ACM3KD_05850 [Hyphomicrobiaceae bacterium]
MFEDMLLDQTIHFGRFSHFRFSCRDKKCGPLAFKLAINLFGDNQKLTRRGMQEAPSLRVDLPLASSKKTYSLSGAVGGGDLPFT